MFHNKLNYKLINITALMLLLYIAVSNVGVWWGILMGIISILAPFITAFALAYTCTPIVHFLEEKGVRKWLAVTIVVIAVIIATSALLIITLPLVYDQLVSFGTTILDVISEVGEKFHLNLGPIEIKMEDYLNEIVKNIGTFISNGTAGFLNGLLSFIGKFIVAFIAWIYFLYDMEKIRKAVKLFLLRHSKRNYLYLKSIDTEFTQYIKGLTIFLLIQLVEYSVLFFIVGHPNWLILGILASITTIIPYFGGLITNIIAVITATTVGIPTLIGTSIICLIFPQVDGYVISPRIYGKTNNVNPLITIMAVSIGGTIAGITGIIVALPIYLFLRTTYQFYKKDLKSSMKKMKTAI